MYVLLYGVVHINIPLLLLRMNILFSGRTVSSLVISPTSYKRNYNVLNASLNKQFPSFTLCEMGVGGGVDGHLVILF